MLEYLKHVFGFCGEGHLSVIWFLSLGGVFIYTFKNNLKVILQIIIDYINKFN